MAQNLASWTGTNCTVATATETTATGQVISFLRATRTGAGPYITSPTGRGTSGKLYRQFRVLARKSAGVAVATNWVGRLSWATSGHGVSASYKDELAAPSNKSLGEWFPVTWSPGDTPTAGGTDWVDSTIDQIKIEMSDGTGDVWDFLAISEGNDGASLYADTAQILPFAVNETVRALTAGSIGPYAGTNLVLQTVTVTTSADEVPEITFGCDVSFTGTASSFIVLNRNTNGGGAAVTSGGSTTIAAANGHAQRFEMRFVDTLATAGTHVYTMEVASGGSKAFANRLMVGRRVKR